MRGILRRGNKSIGVDIHLDGDGHGRLTINLEHNDPRHIYPGRATLVVGKGPERRIVFTKGSYKIERPGRGSAGFWFAN
jgi:hypothetical protein